MVSYEVTVSVHDAVRSAEYEAWLRSTHIPDIMKTGCFTFAELSRESPTRFRTRYLATDRSMLERYFVEYAPSLRADTLAKFGELVTPHRDIWEIVAEWRTPSTP